MGGVKYSSIQAVFFFVFFLLRIYKTYFISLFDLEVCNKVLIIPESYVGCNKEHKKNATLITPYRVNPETEIILFEPFFCCCYDGIVYLNMNCIFFLLLLK